ncbi:5-oxoprolinase subunit B family protein [Luteimicrobium subarcticum]|uniref:KipI family sensor histidine kinase inhibitor n=1 Tax=Luteimicrobium subarcticum TaxID=620910 RepID=A0A2M8W191_9MICO|nr:carboxyltransferase domain-containing protein [Luteimicrobium subarcticum]PJI84704.1 KipI family sensor histidine kinase inhibitor [Luteimicrobium subarcticum]
MTRGPAVDATARRLGPGAVMVDVGSDDPARVVAVAAAVRALPGLPVADVVPAACTVLVIFADGRRAADVDVAAVAAAARAALLSVTSAPAAGATTGAPTGLVTRTVERAAGSPDVLEVPTVYDGPDLVDVAQASELTVDELVARHAARTYMAAFVGFAPGFAYLRGLDPRIVATRLDSPRAKVPAGAVAVAGGMTAVYPRVSPGGWRLLGRTALELFDVARVPPALVEPGRPVRFVPVDDHRSVARGGAAGRRPG